MKNFITPYSRNTEDNNDDRERHIGRKMGCLEVIGINGHSENGYIYKCRCECGNIIQGVSEKGFASKKHRYCSKSCGRRKVTIKSNWENKRRATLWVEKTDESEIISTSKGSCNCKVYKCTCHLCEKQYKYNDYDFIIKNNDSKAKCNCYKHSQFQWRIIELLEMHDIPYIAECGVSESKYRYDFAILDKEYKTIKYLIECHGDQHYYPIRDFGGLEAWKGQRKRDIEKLSIAENNNIPLIIIPYTYKIDEIEHILESFEIYKT